MTARRRPSTHTLPNTTFADLGVPAELTRALTAVVR